MTPITVQSYVTFRKKKQRDIGLKETYYCKQLAFCIFPLATHEND